MTIRTFCATLSHVRVTQLLDGESDELMATTILYIEDDPYSVRMVQKMLHTTGYKVCIEMTGKGGVVSARQLVPDLIFLDINLPDISGFEVVEHIKATPELGNIPIVALTANDQVRDRKEGLEFGFDAYLSKPVGRAELLKTIHNILTFVRGMDAGV